MMRRAFVVMAALVCAVLVSVAVPSVAGAAQGTDPPSLACAAPRSAGESFRRAAPEDVELDPGAVRDAITFATVRNRLSVSVFRHGCLVGESGRNALTDGTPSNIWSVTKSVVSMLIGIAEADGKLKLDDPIGKHLPDGLGDRAHRAITIRNILTEASGYKFNFAADIGTPASTDTVKQALAYPIEHEPGTRFGYSQLAVDLLVFVLERAVGQDVQEYAQQRLFEPIGIPRDSWFWQRDRAGNTNGWANLYMQPARFARFGLLLGSRGYWNGKQVIPADYIERARRPSTTNPAFGLLLGTNEGDFFITPDLPSEQRIDRRLVASAPKDLFLTAGALSQNNFVIPSLGITVTWTGVFGDLSANPAELASFVPGSDLFHEFFRKLLRGVRDVDVPDPGPYESEPIGTNLDPTTYVDPAKIGNNLGLGPHAAPGCVAAYCAGSDPVKGTVQTGADAARAVPGAARAPR